jgi:hypothetical protein
MSTFDYYTERRTINGDNVVISMVRKAYTSLSFKGNTMETSTPFDTWTQIKTEVAPTIGAADTGNCQIDDNGDDTYTFQYVDPEGLNRVFLMNVSFYIDLSIGLVSKTYEFRAVLKRGGTSYPMDTFAIIDGISASSPAIGTVVLQLIPDDQIYFELKNITNSDDGVVKIMLVSVVEV